MNSDQPTPSEFEYRRQLQIDSACDRFEEKWRAGARPRLEAFLEEYQEPFRSQLLVHLLRLEFEYRSSQGDQLVIQEYFDRFPHDRSVIHIVHEEQARRRCPDETESRGSTPFVDGRSNSRHLQSIASRHGRFVPGTMLAGRYRIVSLLGNGGMGEVYRADDLKLGHAVALKFLPEELAKDPKRLEYFHNEVRLARQVSHPNVCRVYDIDEVNGYHYLSMEYIDGEDLKDLLRRIGRLPTDKGIQITQQLCAGLAAAHERGVLHRDLKPANIMIDGRGQVRITDFGLAKILEDGEDHEVAGTPAYMAPEQLLQGLTSIQSDLYSLGLTCYEIFTGRPIFSGHSIQDIIHAHEESSLPIPSTMPVFDPTVERVVMHCLSKDPHDRPLSAHAVAVALPGGDPLANALAAGETPSPELVAAAGGVGALQPPHALALFLSVLVGLAVVLILAYQTTLDGLIKMTAKPQVLANTAEGILADIGYSSEVLADLGYSHQSTIDAHSAYGFVTDYELIDRIRSDAANRGLKDWRTKLADGATAVTSFWYRAGPNQLVAESFFDERTRAFVGTGRISWDQPPFIDIGMIRLRLSPRQELLELNVVPRPQNDTTRSPGRLENDATTQRSVLAAFRAAGLIEDASESELFEKYDSVAPAWFPSGAYNKRAAFVPEMPATTRPSRIEIATLNEQLVYFRVFSSDHLDAVPQDASAQAIGDVLAVVMAIVSFLLAWRHLRSGRGDRRGALRLGYYVFFVWFGICLLYTPHEPAFTEIRVLILAIARSLFAALNFWLCYLAIEPIVRRQFPETLISWSRLLAGQIGDPRVGRDTLVGVLAGTVDMLLFQINVLSPKWAGVETILPMASRLDSRMGISGWLRAVLESQMFALYVGLVLMLLGYIVLNALLRYRWLAAIAFVSLYSSLFDSWYGPIAFPSVSLFPFAILCCLILFVLTRYGLLSVVVLAFVREILEFSVTREPTTWYLDSYLFALILVAVLGGCAYYTAVLPHKVRLVS